MGLKYNNWYNDNPDWEQEKCVAIKTFGLWNNWGCHEKAAFICEKDIATEKHYYYETEEKSHETEEHYYYETEEKDSHETGKDSLHEVYDDHSHEVSREIEYEPFAFRDTYGYKAKHRTTKRRKIKHKQQNVSRTKS